jgi:type IV secretory pathway TraG/TraD family ATPase VirD4
MLIDIAFLTVSVVYYIAEYNLLHSHLYPADILFAGYGFYRLLYGLRDKKAYTTKRWQMIMNLGILFIPFAYLITFGLTKTGFHFSVIHVGTVLCIIFLVIIASTPRLYLSDRKVILEDHKTDMKDIEREPYSVYFTEDIFIPGHQRFRHLEIIGLTGTGKTRYGIFPAVFQDIHNGAGVFIYDIKSDMHTNIKKFVSYSNRDYDLSIFTLGNLGGETYNPLANGSASEISNRIFTALYPPENMSNEYYRDNAKDFLESAIGLLKSKYPVITFKDLYLLAQNPRTILREFCLEFEDRLESKNLVTNFLDKEPKELDKVLSGLRLKLGAFVIPPWTKQINTTDPDIRMDKLLVDNKILLFQASSGLFQSEYKPISVLALKDIQTEIARRYEKPPKKPFFIYLDEFYNVVYPDFGEMINKARSARVGVILAHQSIGDLERCGDELRNIIIDNTVHKLIFKVGTADTAEFYAKLIGTRLVMNQVESHKDDGKVAGYTSKEEREFKIDPDTFKNLRTNKENDTAEAVLLIETDKGRVYGKYLLSNSEIDFVGQTLLPKPERKGQGKDTNLESYMYLTKQNGSKFIKTSEHTQTTTKNQKETLAEPSPHTFKKRKGTLSAFDVIKENEKDMKNKNKSINEEADLDKDKTDGTDIENKDKDKKDEENEE